MFHLPSTNMYLIYRFLGYRLLMPHELPRGRQLYLPYIDFIGGTSYQFFLDHDMTYASQLTFLILYACKVISSSNYPCNYLSREGYPDNYFVSHRHKCPLIQCTSPFCLHHSHAQISDRPSLQILRDSCSELNCKSVVASYMSDKSDKSDGR